MIALAGYSPPNFFAAIVPHALAVVVSHRPCDWRSATPTIILAASSCQPGRPSVAITALIDASSPDDISHHGWLRGSMQNCGWLDTRVEFASNGVRSSLRCLAVSPGRIFN